MAITPSEARKALFPLIEQVNDDIAVEITSKRSNALLLSLADYQSLDETAYLLRTPADARRLLESRLQAPDERCSTGSPTWREPSVAHRGHVCAPFPGLSR